MSAAGFGVMPIFALYAYQSKINVMTLLFIRFALSAMVFWSFLWITKQKFKLTKAQVGAFFLMGGVLYTLQSTLYFNSLRFMSASLTTLLFYTYPIIVSLLSFLTGNEKLTKRHILAIISTSLGLMLILGMSGNNRINPAGIVLAFGAALVYSGYIWLGDRLVQKVPSMISSSLVTLFSTLSFTIIGLGIKTLSFDFGAKAWLPIIGIIIFSTIMSIAAFFKGLELTGPATASILSTLEPLVTIGLSFILFHDRLTVYQMIGGLAVISGAVIIVLAKRITVVINESAPVTVSKGDRT
ncbi:MAG TPA: EamA family transporter [Firmicutes bacterium]|nr:EamA family transporter [Bacillota bacterium]